MKKQKDMGDSGTATVMQKSMPAGVELVQSFQRRYFTVAWKYKNRYKDCQCGISL